MQTPEVAKRLKSGEWQAEEQAKNVLAQGPDTAVCESRNKLAIAQTKFRSTIHKLTYPLKTPSCGMFLASLSGPPLIRLDLSSNRGCPRKRKGIKGYRQERNGVLLSAFLWGGKVIISKNIFTLAKYSRIEVRYARLDLGVLALYA